MNKYQFSNGLNIGSSPAAERIISVKASICADE